MMCELCGNPLAKDGSPCKVCERELLDSYCTLTLASSMLNIVRAFAVKDLKAVSTLVACAEAIARDEEYRDRFYVIYHAVKKAHAELKEKRANVVRLHDSHDA